VSVADLIKKLFELDPELEVVLDGCDCEDAWPATVDVDDERVVLIRSDHG
jgi:hypothetical protein